MEQHDRKALEHLVSSQVGKWQLAAKTAKETGKPDFRPVIAISRLPGCGTPEIARAVAGRLGFDIFNGSLVDMVAEDAHLSKSVAQTLDEKAMSDLEEWVKSLIEDKYFSSDNFFFRLSRLVSTIGAHGGAVIIGRGAAFMLPEADCLRVQLTAPLEARISNVTRKYGVRQEDARRSIINRESDRKAYVRRYFNADMCDPLHYDVVLNTALFSTEQSADIIVAAWRAKLAWRSQNVK
ncbi:MAG: cytidylate kinase-like family protein [Elusimicrobiales bacterium]